VCDIVLAVSRPNIVPVLIEGLKKLECHGYDSARIAVIGQGNMKCVRAIGRVAELEASSAGTSIVIGLHHPVRRPDAHGNILKQTRNVHEAINPCEVAKADVA